LVAGLPKNFLLNHTTNLDICLEYKDWFKIIFVKNIATFKMTEPNKNTPFPLAHYDRLCFLKNIIKNPNITVGDYTYYDDFEDVMNFEKNVK
jgi:hypothetical protein